jgi:hypothetical protein
VKEVYRSAPQSVGLSVHSSSKSWLEEEEEEEEEEEGPADNVLNIVAQKLQSKGTYKAFGKHTAQVPSLGDEMAKCYKKKIYIYINDAIWGRAIAQAVSRWLQTAAARVQTRVWSSGICGGQSGTGVGFLRALRYPLPIFIPPNSPSS